MTEPLAVKKFSHLVEAAQLRKLAERAAMAIENYERDFPDRQRLGEWKELIDGVRQVADRLEGEDQVIPPSG